MKIFLFNRILPIFISFCGILFFKKDLQRLFFHDKNNIEQKLIANRNYIDNFSNNSSIYQSQFLSSTNEILILGSSELTSASKFVPYLFLKDSCKLPVFAVGHAGNQSFSIYCQLLAKNRSLNNAKVVVLVSPSWFFGQAANGTHSQIFFEYISDNFLHEITKIEKSKEDFPFFMYAQKGMSKHLESVSNLSIETKSLMNDYTEDGNVFHSLGAQILKPYYSSSIYLKSQLFEKEKKQLFTIKNQKTHTPDWESLMQASLKEFELISSNNTFGVDSTYYNEYVKGETTTIELLKINENQEYKDFVMLLKLLKHYKADVSFVIMPLNPNYYVDLKRLNPLINDLTFKMEQNNFKVLNLWQPDKSKYVKGLLNDVMHFGDYGWLKVNQFVYENYKEK
jgi:D-alanine transfer protein